MKAKEMFEKLGYEQRINDNEQIYYYFRSDTLIQSLEFRKFAKDFLYHCMVWLANDSLTWTTMSKENSFRDEFDKYCAKYGKWQVETFNYIDYKLLQAINKQVEELGWNNE